MPKTLIELKAALVNFTLELFFFMHSRIVYLFSVLSYALSTLLLPIGTLNLVK